MMIYQYFQIVNAVGVGQHPDGYRIDFADGTSRLATPAEILAAAKAARIAAINTECRARILAVWPAERQISALAGVYGQAEKDAVTALIAAHIDASNAASDEINLQATDTVAKVEEVTVTWPA